jgi:hypothetical protein
VAVAGAWSIFGSSKLSNLNDFGVPDDDKFEPDVPIQADDSDRHRIGPEIFRKTVHKRFNGFEPEVLYDNTEAVFISRSLIMNGHEMQLTACQTSELRTSFLFSVRHLGQ